MALNKSPIQQILDAFKSHGAISFQLWMEENTKTLIEQEREMVAAAWLEGNRQGWEMNTDWPEHGFVYYDENYGKAL